MTHVHVFSNQVEGLRYFMLRLISAANRGWFDTDEVKDLFRRQVEGQGNENVGAFFGLVCLPIIGFFRGVVNGGDDSMYTDFSVDLKRPKGRGVEGPLEGTVRWFSQWTPGRMFEIEFDFLGGCRMRYDLGDGKTESGFLGFEINETTGELVRTPDVPRYEQAAPPIVPPLLAQGEEVENV